MSIFLVYIRLPLINEVLLHVAVVVVAVVVVVVATAVGDLFRRPPDGDARERIGQSHSSITHFWGIRFVDDMIGIYCLIELARPSQWGALFNVP